MVIIRNVAKISGLSKVAAALDGYGYSYEYLNKITPRVGTVVDCRDGRGVVVDTAVLTGKLKVQLNSSPEGAPPITVNRGEVRIVKK